MFKFQHRKLKAREIISKEIEIKRQEKLKKYKEKFPIGCTIKHEGFPEYIFKVKNVRFNKGKTIIVLDTVNLQDNKISFFELELIHVINI